MVGLPFGVPGTAEAVWRTQGSLEDLPTFDTSTVTALVLVAAHPDDETLGAAGLLAHGQALGWDIQVIVVTNGEGSHPDSPTHSPEQLSTVRRQEVTAAVGLAAPRAELLFLDLPDGEISSFVEDLTARLRSEIIRLPATGLVVTPWAGDRHPDHAAVAEAAALACAGTEARLFGYPIWAWHWSGPSAHDLPENMQRLDLTPAESATKNDALACHTSQIGALSAAAGDEAVVPPEMLEHFLRPFEVFIPCEPVPVTDDVGDGSLGQEFFDEFYGDTEDPWGFADRWYERRKRSILLASLPREHFAHAFEPGCANGDLTVDLAQRCDVVLATEISAMPRERAASRLAGEPGVTISGNLPPDRWPVDTFDLVILSEIGYYCSRSDLEAMIDAALRSLTHDGVLVLCHWRHPVAEYPLTGDEVHAAFRSRQEIEVLSYHEEADFLLEVHTRPPARSVAVATGIAEDSP